MKAPSFSFSSPSSSSSSSNFLLAGGASGLLIELGWAGLLLMGGGFLGLLSVNEFDLLNVVFEVAVAVGVGEDDEGIEDDEEDEEGDEDVYEGGACVLGLLAGLDG